MKIELREREMEREIEQACNNLKNLLLGMVTLCKTEIPIFNVSEVLNYGR